MKVTHIVGPASRMLGFLVFTSALFLDRSASAQILEYTSESSYAAASSATATFNFDNLTSSTGTAYGPFTISGVTFVAGPGTNLYAMGANYNSYPSGAYNFDGSVTLDAENYASPTSTLTVTLPNGVSSIGVDLGGLFVAPVFTATLTLTSGATESFTFDASDGNTSGLGFLGFVATGGNTIKSVSYTDATVGDYNEVDFAADNFTYGVAATATPEPGSLILLNVEWSSSLDVCRSIRPARRLPTRSGVSRWSARRSVTNRSSFSIGIDRPGHAALPFWAQVAQV